MQRETAFVSYAREDGAGVDRIVRILETLQYDVWLDRRSLAGGQAWWDVIIDSIQRCDLMIVAVSRSMLRSQACTTEFEYARSLAKPVLPVIVDPVSPELLPTELGRLQFVDLLDHGEDPGLKLAAALRRLPPAPPLPAVRPAPPPPPVTYLTTLAEAVRTPGLDANAQLALAARLEQAAENPSEARLVADLAREMLERDDLFHRAARSLDRLLGSLGTSVVPDPAADVPVTVLADDSVDAAADMAFSATLKAGGSNSREYEVRYGDAVWNIRFEFPVFGANRVFVNAVEIKLLEKILPVGPGSASFQFDLLAYGNRWQCDIRSEGAFRLKGTMIMVGGEALHSDGSLSR